MVSHDACGSWRLREFICFSQITDIFFVLDWTIRWVNTLVTSDFMFIVHHYTALIHRVAHHWTYASITYSSLWSVWKIIHNKVLTRYQFTGTLTLCAMCLCKQDNYSKVHISMFHNVSQYYSPPQEHIFLFDFSSTTGRVEDRGNTQYLRSYILLFTCSRQNCRIA